VHVVERIEAELRDEADIDSRSAERLLDESSDQRKASSNSL
jgi:hypothetical protein